MICLGHYERNPLNDRKAQDLQAALQRLPNGAGRREFEECYFRKMETAEP